MAIDCGSCDDLRANAPEYSTQGVTNKVCNYLKNNTGLGGKSDNCTDLDDANDCTIGLMDGEIEAYDPCEWKEFMHKFIPNLHAMIKAMVCDACGQWNKIERLDCLVDLLFNGVSFRVGEVTSGDAYAVAGKGVSFLIPYGSTPGSADIRLNYIAGGLMRLSGSYRLFNTNFTDDAQCLNFDTVDANNDATLSQNRLGNSVWGDPYKADPGGTTTFPQSGGELMCEFRIRKAAYPQIKSIYMGLGQEAAGGSYSVQTIVTDGDGDEPYAYGQHGSCSHATGVASNPNYDAGHLVPSGWMYIQLRMSSCVKMTIDQVNGSQYSPNVYMGVRMNINGTGC